MGEMQEHQTEQNLVTYLRSALGALELEADSSLYRDTVTICDHFENPVFRIAVFGPFNYGKSTLLNALLGRRTLPIDLIPTTGAAIQVGYGDCLKSQIVLNNGEVIEQEGTKILQDYAILNEQRYMREDVRGVKVYCPHPFLKTGVEFLDLPGTNDREAQDNLVQAQLLKADLIVQVLDARKLMTLGERENLRDWLMDRGITTVIFVVNFLNLLEPDEQKTVSNRMRFVAESFRSHLPPGINNIYRVDALPALRAQLKGNSTMAQTTGLTAFESALQHLVQFQQDKTAIRLPRILKLVSQVQQRLQEKVEKLEGDIQSKIDKVQQQNEIKNKAQKLILEGLQRSVSEFESWLYLPNLLKNYQSELAQSLQENNFKSWNNYHFQPEILKQKQSIQDWFQKAASFFNFSSNLSLNLDFILNPEVIIPDLQNEALPSSGNDDEPVVIAAGVGLVLWVIVRAAVAEGTSYILNRVSHSKLAELKNNLDLEEMEKIYQESAKKYLTQFSENAFTNLHTYHQQVEQMIHVQVPQKALPEILDHHQLQLLKNLRENLDQVVESLKHNETKSES